MSHSPYYLFLLSLSLTLSLHLCLSIFLSFLSSLSLYLCVSVCLSVCLSLPLLPVVSAWLFVLLYLSCTTTRSKTSSTNRKPQRDKEPRGAFALRYRQPHTPNPSPQFLTPCIRAEFMTTISVQLWQ